MHRREFVIPVADLEDGPEVRRWEISVDWLKEALKETDAAPSGESGSLEVELMKNGREVLVRGTAKAGVTMPCARTLDPVGVVLAPDIFLLLTQGEPRADGGARAGRQAPRHTKRARGPSPERGRREGTAAGSSARGSRRPEPGRPQGDDPELPSEDAAKDVFQGAEIVLDPFVREFLLLDLPMVVRRSDLPADSEPGNRAAAETPPERPLDQRLKPLLEIAERIRATKE